MKFTQPPCLCQAVRHINVCARNRGRIDLVFMFGVGAHGCHVLPGFKPRNFKNWPVCGCRRHNDMGTRYCFLGIGVCNDRQALLELQLFDERLRPELITRPYSDFSDRSHQSECLELQSRLDSAPKMVAIEAS